MEKTLVLFLAFGLLPITACTHCPEISESPTQQTSDFTFWAVCGECIQLTDKFSIHDGMLFDKSGQILQDSLLQFAKTLQTNMPDVLCTSSSEYYGCGSCYDGISFFVQTGCSVTERTWQFDPYDTDNPADVKAYAMQVQDVFWKCAE